MECTEVFLIWEDRNQCGLLRQTLIAHRFGSQELTFVFKLNFESSQIKMNELIKQRKKKERLTDTDSSMVVARGREVGD